MAEKIQLPDGSFFPLKPGEDPAQAMMVAASLYPEAFAQPAPKKEAPVKEPGVFDRMGRGLESLLSTQSTALGSIYDKDYAKKALERQQKISEKYGGTDDWEAVKKKYEESGLMSAAGEYLRRVPGALAEQAPQIAESAAAARVGAFGGAPGAALGLVAPSYTQAYGALLEREAEEQAKQGKQVDPSKLQAAALAVPYSAVDIVARYVPMGKGIVKTVLGEDVAKLLFRGATKEAEELAAKKLMSEGFMKTLGVGLAKGAAYEIPGELSQQMMERFQAGLPLLNDDALAEYGKTAFSTSMLAPLGGAGRFADKSAARQLVEKNKQEADAKAAAEQQRLADIETAKREEFQKTPEYLTDVQQRYDTLLNKLSGLEAATKVKPEGKDPASQQIAEEQKKVAVKELKDFKTSDEYLKTVAEYIKAKPRIKESDAQRKATEDLFGQQDLYTQEDVSPDAQIANLQAQIANLKKEQAKKGMTPAQQQPLQNRINALEEALYGAERLYGDKTTVDTKKTQQQISALEQQYQRLSGNKFASQETLRNLRDKIQELKLQPVGGMPSGLIPSVTQTEIKSARELLTQRLKDAQSKITTDFATADLERHSANIARYENALKKLDTLQKTALEETPSLFDLQDQMDTAQQQGDVDAVRRLTPMLAEAEKQGQLDFLPPDVDATAEIANLEKEVQFLTGVLRSSALAKPEQQTAILKDIGNLKERIRRLSTGVASDRPFLEEIAQGREDAARRQIGRAHV